LEEARAEFKLAGAETKLSVLTKFTKAATLKQLRSEVDDAKVEEHARERLVAMEREKQTQAKTPARTYSVSSRTDLVVRLMDDAVEREQRVAALLGEVKELAVRAEGAPKAKDAADSLEAKRAEARKLSAEAESLMNEAVTLSNAVTASWTRIRAVQNELRSARRELVRLQ
jgi:hypothetical protein